MKNKKQKNQDFLSLGFFSKSKKGNWTLEEFLKLVLAVIGISILFGAATSFAGIFMQDNKLKQAEASLEKIYFAIEEVRNGENQAEVFLESPNKWFIVTWPQTRHEDKPSQCKGDYCICICKVQCDEEDKAYCKDILVDVRTKGILGDSAIWIGSSTLLKVYREEGAIIIKEIKNEK